MALNEDSARREDCLSLYDVFRSTCARLARPRGEVLVDVFQTNGVPSVNLLDSTENDDSYMEGYRLVNPDWLYPVDGVVLMSVKVEHGAHDRYERIYLDERGAWRDEARTKPRFAATAPRVSLRAAAIARLGEARVIEAETLIAETIHALLSSGVLAANGFKVNRSRPAIRFRWSAGKSFGGRTGVRFALYAHAAKPEKDAFFREYAAFADQPMIGSFRGSRNDCLRVLAAHELAHWIQFSPKVKRPPGEYKKAHGTGFQKIYWILRSALGLRSSSTEDKAAA